MNFFKSQLLHCALFENNNTWVRVLGLEYLCDVSLFYLMTAAQFWVSALRLTLRFTQCREREEGAPSVSLLLLILLTRFLGLSYSDYLRAPGDSLPPSQVSTSQVCLRVGAGEIHRSWTELRDSDSSIQCPLRSLPWFLYSHQILRINILIIHAACFYSNSGHHIPRKCFCMKSFWLLLSFVLVVWKWWRTEPEPPLLHEFTTPS